jgi:hypothetical protein
MVSRNRKFAVTTALLILWQIGTGFMSSMPAHAQASAAQIGVDAPMAMGAMADGAEPPCHGHQAAEVPKPVSTDPPPCCQTHGCHGDCFVSPTLPVVVRVVVIRPAETTPILVAAVAWHSAPPVEFFRPPI